jgi:hypothetical protein
VSKKFKLGCFKANTKYFFINKLHLFFRHTLGARDMTMSLFHNLKLKRAKIDPDSRSSIDSAPEPYTDMIAEHSSSEQSTNE